MQDLRVARRWWTALGVALGVALGSGQARAAADTFGLGDGHDGSPTVSGVVNAYAALTAAAAAGATQLSVDTTSGFVTGDLVLVWQTTGFAPAPASGDQTAFSLASTQVGAWELARLGGASGTSSCSRW